MIELFKKEVINIKAEIISIGTELLIGEILNTNSKYIAEKLANIGIDLYYQTTVGDNYDRIKEVLKIAFKRSDLVITTGGLGPTVDDLTKEVVSDYFDEELIVVNKYYEKIKEKYKVKGFGENIASGGKKEASIVKNSKIIENEVGLAPGFFLEKNEKKIIVLPGPPKELEYMIDNEVIKLLKEYSSDILVMKTLEIRGVPEGKIDDELNEYFKMKNPTIAPYAKEGCVHIRIAVKGAENLRDELNGKVNKIISEIKKIYPMATEI